MDESVLIAIADAIYGDLRRTDARELTVEKADDYIKNFALVKSMGLSDDDCKKIKYLMEQSGQFVYVQMQGATLISRDTVRWLGGEREENIEWKYWLRLRNYLSLESGFSNAILNRLDEESRDIINLCGDPDLEGSWKRAGLVVGHVQSGKTTNYSAVISKGISAGYKVFLVFAGITNSLRLQTQERLEDNVTGRSARRDGETAESLWTDSGYRAPQF